MAKFVICVPAGAVTFEAGFDDARDACLGKVRKETQED